MKKIIISMLALVIGVTAFTATAFADASFNNGSGLLPTVTVSNVTTNPCGYGAGIGCWSTTTTAQPGDEIAAQISFANTSNETAKNVTVSLQPSRSGTLVSFYGGAAATNANRTTGTATVTLSQAETVMQLGGDQRPDWRTNQDSTPREVDVSALFGQSGFNVGDIAPGVQGVLTVRFKVNGSVTPPTTCSINTFAASPNTIQSGSQSSLNWTTTNCTSVSIASVASNLAANGSQSVAPTNTTTYTLTAFPGGTTATTTVTVTNPTPTVCSINNFSASPSTIQAGNGSTLNWTTTGCNYVNVSSVGTNLATTGSQIVYPPSTTTYTLTAFPGGTTATAVVTVNPVTNNTCSINNFTASPSTINQGGSSSLIWNTTNCTYVSISSVGSNLAANGSQSVSPANTTTYTLTAYPGGVTSTVTVVVNTINPSSCYINNFNANPSSITIGSASSLSWNTSGCTSVTISGYGGLPVTGSQSVYPTYTTTYTLTAYPGGTTSTATVYVYGAHNNYCSINSFYVDSNSIAQGQTTVLHWSTSGSSSVYLSGFGNENATGSLSISPYASTSYTLTLNGCSGSGLQTQSVYVTVTYLQQQNITLKPQAITTVASVLNAYAAVLNGIAVPNNNYGTTSAWFEYGDNTGLGNRTNVQAVTTNGSNPYSANISGLNGGQTYYYRAVVQNQGGIAYGSIVPFTTPAPSVTVTPPTRVIVQTRTVTINSGTTAKSQASLFKLEVDSDYDHMCIGGDIDYTVNYQNISSQELQNSILRITFPGELTYASASQGDYDVTDRTLTINLGTVEPGQTGSVTVHAQVNQEAVQGKLAVITATMVYTNPSTHAQEQAIAYSLITVSNDCPSVLGASVFGFGGFLPNSLIEWLLLILIILALIVLIRSLTRKREEPVRTV